MVDCLSHFHVRTSNFAMANQPFTIPFEIMHFKSNSITLFCLMITHFLIDFHNLYYYQYDEPYLNEKVHEGKEMKIQKDLLPYLKSFKRNRVL